MIAQTPMPKAPTEETVTRILYDVWQAAPALGTLVMLFAILGVIWGVGSWWFSRDLRAEVERLWTLLERVVERKRD